MTQLYNILDMTTLQKWRTDEWLPMARDWTGEEAEARGATRWILIMMEQFSILIVVVDT